jgi:uncharacterized protein (TIGR02266 family)
MYDSFMTHPAEEARKYIMDGLEACQSDPQLADAFDKLAEHLAKAQGKLFPAAKLPSDSPGSVDMMRKAMDHLAQALKSLQDLNVDSDTVTVAAGSIAKALKTLHPTVKAAKDKAARNSIAPKPSRGDGGAMRINVNTMLSMNTDHQFYTGFSEDIEDGGIFIATFEPKPMEAEVIVNFKLPGDIPVSAKGVVQFVRNYNPSTPEVAPGMGIKFTDIMPKDKKAIEKYLKSRTPMFYDE